SSDYRRRRPRRSHRGGWLVCFGLLCFGLLFSWGHSFYWGCRKAVRRGFSRKDGTRRRSVPPLRATAGTHVFEFLEFAEPVLNGLRVDWIDADRVEVGFDLAAERVAGAPPFPFAPRRIDRPAAKDIEPLARAWPRGRPCQPVRGRAQRLVGFEVGDDL